MKKNVRFFFALILLGISTNTFAHTIHNVKAGAAGTGSGPVSVLHSVPPPPVITSFAPLRGPVGTQVTITGSDFNATPANNVVFFGAVRATVLTASATALTVKVPAGATHASITVLNLETGLAAYSGTFFLPTFSPPKNGITAADFADKEDLPTGGYGGFVTIGDLDGDGLPDLVVTHPYSNTVSVLRNTGSGFAPAVDFATGNASTSVSIGDLDGDGKPDLAVANSGSSNVSVLLNTGSSGNITFDTRKDFPTGDTPNSIAIGDLDGDGRLDLVVAITVYEPGHPGDFDGHGAGARFSGLVSVFRNTGSPGNIAFAPKADFSMGGGVGAASIAIGDLDGDGKLDLAMEKRDGKGVSVLPNTGNPGTIGFGTPKYFYTAATPAFVGVGDLDGDGRLDLVVASVASPFGVGSVSVLHNTGSPGNIVFGGQENFEVGNDFRSLAIGDLNGDGLPDLALVNQSLNAVSVLRNTGSGFAPKVNLTTGNTLEFVAIGDLNGDGLPDLTVASSSSNTVSVLLNAQNGNSVVNIPDANFKAYLVANFDTNNDGEIQVAEAEAVTGTINCSAKNIADLTGIEAFVNLTKLYCYDNQLTNLNVSQNTALTVLNCSMNQLTSLDVSKNTALTDLELKANQLTSLDVSQNTALKYLYCNSNQLTNLDVSHNTALRELVCVANQLTSLDVSHNTDLRDLELQENQLTSLDLSQNTVLIYLTCNSNQLTSLDVSHNTALGDLQLQENQLTSLDVSQNMDLIVLNCSNNQLTSLDVSQNKALESLICNDNQLTTLNIKSGSNVNMTFFNAINNPYLRCIQVDDAAGANEIADWDKDETASYNENCTSASVVNIPDANFKTYLLANFDTNNDGEIQISEAEAVTGTIDCSSKSITDLTGIEAFVNITQLNCRNNQLTNLDVSQNTALQVLYCDANRLTSLDVSGNTALTELRCSSNQLTTLDVSQNTALQILLCYNNLLTSLNIKNGNNAVLKHMQAQNNTNLSCIQVDNVDDAVTNETNLFWQRGNTNNAAFSTDCNATLPVNLLTFTAKTDGNYAKLQWKTASEKNNKGFEIYRSGDDGKFVQLGEVGSNSSSGSLTATATATYFFTDKQPLNGNNYYKLVQIDNDGSETELGVRMVTLHLTSYALHLYPNPTDNTLTVTFTAGHYHTLEVADINGRVLQRLAVKNNEVKKDVSLGNYRAGTYLIRLTGNNAIDVLKALRK